MKQVLTLLLLTISLIANSAELKPYTGGMKNPPISLKDLSDPTHTLAQ